MARFVAIHDAPFTREELIARARALPGYAPEGVSWIASYCDFGAKKHFCEWEAPDEKTLRRVLTLTQTPFDAVHRVVRFDALKGEFED